jgi:hypothetical protein
VQRGGGFKEVEGGATGGGGVQGGGVVQQGYLEQGQLHPLAGPHPFPPVPFLTAVYGAVMRSENIAM